MSGSYGLNRRTLLRHAGLAAAAGAVGGVAPVAAAAPSAALARGARYDFDTVYSRIGTDSTKWDAQIAKYGKDSIVAGMGVADMDFRCAPCITEALKKRIAHENWGYLATPKSFYDAVVQWNAQRYGLTVSPANLEITTGVHPGLIAALRAFSPPGSRVLLTTPTYNGFYGDLAKTGTTAEESPMVLVDGRYSIDFDDFERRIGPDTKTFILCNPQNPTGNCWSRNDLSRLGEICLRHGVVVLADEVHCDFVAKGERYTPFASLDREIAMNSVTFQSANKSFSLAAMKCAWCFSDNPEHMARVKAQNRVDMTTLGMVASLAAYTEGEDWLNQVTDYIDGTMDLAERAIAANMPLVKFVKPQGTYLAWLDVSRALDRIGAKDIAKARRNANAAGEVGVTPETVFEEWLVKNAKVHLNAGHSYGLGGEGHMRMNLAASRKIVTLALDNMAEALRNL
jgi:cysteine-S-conjugate beta-lyase